MITYTKVVQLYFIAVLCKCSRIFSLKNDDSPKYVDYNILIQLSIQIFGRLTKAKKLEFDF